MNRTSRRTGRQYSVRYLTCQKPDDPWTAYRLAIYPNGDVWPPIYTYSQIIVPVRETRSDRVNEKYDINLDGVPFRHACWVNGFKQHEIQIKGFYTTTKALVVPLERCEILADHLEALDGTVRIPAGDFGLTHFPAITRQVEWHGDIIIFAEFEWHLRNVFNQATRRKEFRKVEQYKEGTLIISKSQLGLLHQVIQTAQDQKKLQEVIAKIRSELSKGTYISIEQVEEWLTLAELYGEDPERILRSQCLRGEYEPIFFEMLRDEHDQNHDIYFGSHGFIFHINGKWVWEEPKYGAATYLFRGDHLDGRTLSVALSNLSRTDLLGSDELQTVTGFLNRVIHPKDASVERYLDRWMSEVCG